MARRAYPLEITDANAIGEVPTLDPQVEDELWAMQEEAEQACRRQEVAHCVEPDRDEGYYLGLDN